MRTVEEIKAEIEMVEGLIFTLESTMNEYIDSQNEFGYNVVLCRIKNAEERVKSLKWVLNESV